MLALARSISFSVCYLLVNKYSLFCYIQAKLKKKEGPKYKALSHFDDFYGSVFGDKWQSIREALLRRNKYVAVVNNYGDTEETVEFLENKGLIHLSLSIRK